MTPPRREAPPLQLLIDENLNQMIAEVGCERGHVVMMARRNLAVSDTTIADEAAGRNFHAVTLNSRDFASIVSPQAPDLQPRYAPGLVLLEPNLLPQNGKDRDAVVTKLYEPLERYQHDR